MAPHTCRSAFSSDRRYSRAGSFPASVLKKRTAGTQELYNTGAIFARADPRPADPAVSSYQPCKPQDALERRGAAFADPPRICALSRPNSWPRMAYGLRSLRSPRARLGEDPSCRKALNLDDLRTRVAHRNVSVHLALIRAELDEAALLPAIARTAAALRHIPSPACLTAGCEHVVPERAKPHRANAAIREGNRRRVVVDPPKVNSDRQADGEGSNTKDLPASTHRADPNTFCLPSGPVAHRIRRSGLRALRAVSLACPLNSTLPSEPKRSNPPPRGVLGRGTVAVARPRGAVQMRAHALCGIRFCLLPVEREQLLPARSDVRKIAFSLWRSNAALLAEHGRIQTFPGDQRFACEAVGVTEQQPTLQLRDRQHDDRPETGTVK